MNLDELRTVQSKERRKDSLQHLRDSFYGDVAEYIAELKTERSRAAEEADDPFSSPEVSRLTDEIETAEEVVEAVYERRVGKVVKLASFAAASMPVDDDGMTQEEKALFDDLVSRIETNKENVLDILAGKRRPGDVETDSDATPPTASADPASTTPATPTPDTDTSSPTPHTTDKSDPVADGVLADAMGGGDDGSEEPTNSSSSADEQTTHTPVEPEATPPGVVSTPSSDETSRSVDADSAESEPSATREQTEQTSTQSHNDTERTTVRITQDVGAIFGVDEREYDLAKEDVVSLPTTNADPLIQREAAERLD